MGKYPIVVTATDENGCQGSDSLVYTVVEAPIKVYADIDTTIAIGDTVAVDFTQSEVFDYQWTPSQDIGCDNCAVTKLYPKESRTYIISATDVYGCNNYSPRVKITVTETYTIDMPDGFTPNGDGINEVIFPNGIGIEKINRFEVYNRYGELIHSAGESPGTPGEL